MRISKAVCAVVAETLNGSHATLEQVFKSAGVRGDPPPLAHHSKWKEWLFQATQDPSVDSLAIVGNLLEEFMDLPPKSGTQEYHTWKEKRDRVEAVLEENGLRYYRSGRVLPQGDAVSPSNTNRAHQSPVAPNTVSKPQTVEEVLEIIIKGLRRAMHPLTHRRKGSQSLSFASEYDVQDLLHALLRPWIKDIRPEEFTPSYAGTSTRMDFLLPVHALVVETKIIRDRAHGRRIGDELLVDIAHYRAHPKCKTLWCVVYDPEHFLTNPDALKDLEGSHRSKDGEVQVRVFLPGDREGA